MNPNKITGVLIRRGKLDIDTYKGRTPCRHEHGHLRDKERGLRRNPAGTLIMDF